MAGVRGGGQVSVVFGRMEIGNEGGEGGGGIGRENGRKKSVPSVSPQG